MTWDKLERRIAQQGGAANRRKQPLLSPLADLCVGLQEEEYETMNPKIVIRNETHDDVCTITEVTIVAFKTLEISNHTEQFIIGAT